MSRYFKGGKNMDAFADKLGRVGAWCGQNKYLSAIKNAFQNFMPATIAGAIGVLWTNVLVHETTGLGALWSGIMVLEVLNPIFAAIQYATISCIAIGICMLVAQEIGEANGEKGAYPAVLGFIAWLVVTPTTHTADKFLNAAGEAATFTGIGSAYTGATGLFTALIVGIFALEIFGWLRKQEGLKIKMPEQVPPGVARAFEVLVPTFIMLVIVGAIGHGLFLATGQYVNDLISTYVQAPLTAIIGDNVVAVMILYVIISLFW